MTQVERRRTDVTVPDEGVARLSSTDLRSVGELLVASDQLARGLLFDLDDMDAASALRTWGSVVRNAHGLWVSLPEVASSAEAQIGNNALGDPVLGRLLAMTETLESGLGRPASPASWVPWPGFGTGPQDDRLLRIASNFDTARRLVTSQDPAPSASREVQADVTAARTRVLHTLFVASHGVGLAIGQHVRDLEARRAAPGPRRRLPSESPPVTHLRAVRTAHRRLLAFEHVAASALAGRIPNGLNGEHREPSPASTLAQRLANWDIQAHRSLSNRLSTADLMVVAHTQAVVLSATGHLLRAAAATGHFDSRDYEPRLGPTLEAAQRQWITMARLWADLTPAMTRTVDPYLGRASDAVRAAFHDVLVDRATLSTPDVIGQRADLTKLHPLLAQALVSGTDLAQATYDAASVPELSAPARAILAVVTQHQTPKDPQTVDGSPPEAWVSARDHMGNRVIPLPDEMRSLLRESASELVQLSNRAGFECEATTQRSTAAALTGTGETTRLKGRAKQAPLPSAVDGSPLRGLGCDR